MLLLQICSNILSRRAWPAGRLAALGARRYFHHGLLTDEVIADLAKVRSLRVTSRMSSMACKNTNKDVKAIARELGVRHILQGNVRRAGRQLRVTAQLIDASTDAPLWAENYDGTVEDVFTIQERLARLIVRALELHLTHDEERRLAERPHRGT